MCKWAGGCSRASTVITKNYTHTFVVAGCCKTIALVAQATSSCGSGPDSHALKATPFSVPFAAVSAPAPLFENPFLATTLGAPGCSAPGTASDQFAAMQQLAVLMSTFQQSQGLVQGLAGGDATTPPFDPNLLASLFLPVANTAAPQMPVLRSTDSSLSSSPESMPSTVMAAMNEQ